MRENDEVRACESNPDEPQQRLKRRGLIAGAALVAATIAKNTAQPVGAAGGPVVLDTRNDRQGATGTSIFSPASPTFQGSYTGNVSGGTGVAGTASSTGGIGVKGVANEGVGVQGAINPGAFPSPPIGVQGVNSASSVGATGVQGYILGTADSTFGMEGINGGVGNYRTGIQGTIRAIGTPPWVLHNLQVSTKSALPRSV